MKLHAKMLANRILPLMPSLISLHQLGFVPGRESRDNTLKAIHILNWITTNSLQGFFLSIDAEKAFNRVS